MSQELLKKLSRYCVIALICAMIAVPAAPVWATSYAAPVDTTTGDDASATGGNATAIGNDADASGDDSTALGNSAKAYGEESTAVGYKAQAEGEYSTVLGANATATQNWSTAVGYKAQAEGEYSTVLGANATTAALSWSTAVGYNAQAKEDYSTVLGAGASASDSWSIAVGYKAQASGDYSTVLGANATASDSWSTAVGSNAYAGVGSAALGDHSNAGEESVAIGTNSVADKTYATAVGIFANARNLNSVALGYDSNTTADNQVSIGQYVSSAWSSTRTLVGLKSSVSADGSGTKTFKEKLTAAAASDNAKYAAVNVSDLKALADEIGGGGTTYTSTDNIDVNNTAGTISLKDNIQLSNAGSIDIGAGTKIADGKLIVGSGSAATGTYASAIGGQNASASGKYSTAIGGSGSKATGTNSVAIGGGNAQGANSIAIGAVQTTTTSNEVAIGSSNKNRLTFMGNQNVIQASKQKLINIGSSVQGMTGSTFIEKLTAASNDAQAKYAAVNVSDLKSLADEIGGGGTTYTSTDNIDVDNTAGTISLKDNIKLTDNGSIDVGSKTKIANGKLTVDGTAIDAGGVKVGTNTTLADGSLTIGSSTLTSSALSVGTSALTTDTLKVGGKTYVNAAGINANSAKITNVAAGTLSTDAANVSQLITVSASRNITLVETTNQNGSKNYEISAAGGGGTTYTSTDNIDVNNTVGTISLKDNIKLTDNGSIDVGSKTKIANGKLTVDGTTIDAGGVKVGTTTTLADGSLTIGSSTLTSSALSVGTSSLTTSALKVGGAEYINASGVNANNNKITNVAAETSATDAAAVGQTVSKITSGTSNVKVEESTAGDGSKEYKISVDGGGSGGKIYTAGKNIKLTGTDETVINLDDTVKLAENGSISVGEKTYIDANGLNANSKKITNVAAGTEDTDAASYGQLKAQKEASEKYTDEKTAEAKDYTDTKAAEAKDYTDTKAAEAKDYTDTKAAEAKSYTDSKADETLSAAKGYTDNKVKEAVVKANYNGTENISVDNDNRTIALKENLKLGASADIAIGADGKNTKVAQEGVTVTDGNDKAELTATGLKVNGKDTIDFKDNPEEGKATITNLAAGTDDTDAVTMQQLTGAEEEGTNIELKSVLTEKGEMKKVSLTNNVKLDEAGSITIGNKPSPMLRAAGGTEYTEQTADSFTASDGTNTSKLTATKLAVGKSEVTTDSLKIDGKEYINAAGINANGQKIINVANGTIAQNSKDAVNGGQLWDAYNRMSNIDNRMFDMDNRINDVYNDVSGVGSQAAAMSALQAIPYNPYAPTTVTAGLGFYRSDQAVAVGVYHYIRDTVLLNVGGAFNLNGHGDAMGRAGISFALGKGAGKGGQSIGRNVLDLQNTVASLRSEVEALKTKDKEKQTKIDELEAENSDNKKIIAESKKTMEENMKLIKELKKALEEKKK